MAEHNLKEFVSRVGGLSYNLTCLPQGPGTIQFLKRRKTAASFSVYRANHMLHPALVPDGGISKSGSDEGGENGLNDDNTSVPSCALTFKK